MNQIKILICRSVILLLLPLSSIQGETVIIRTPSGHSLTMDIEPDAPFSTVIQEVKNRVNAIEQNETNFVYIGNFLIDFMFGSPSASNEQSKKREYYQPLTVEDKEDISYILKTLAKSSWTQLLGAKQSLKRAGDRVDHVHPLNFLTFVFSKEELKGSLHSIKDRSKIWKEFFSGISKSLEEEANLNNLLEEHINDFAIGLNLDPSIIKASLANHQWNTFLQLLLQHLPRTGKPDRYDI